MLQLEYELKKLCREHRVDGRTTQGDRLELAATVARDLDASGHHRFSRLKGASRKPKDKHIRSLVDHWVGKDLSPGTINNRLALLRRICDWTGRRGVMSKRNADYHDGKRVREATVSKAVYVKSDVLNRVQNRFARASLRLQVAFGLRRKEALMIQPALADRGNRIVLEGTWTKGGRRREIPLTTAAQREALDHAKAVAGKGSLIPSSLSYKAYRDGLWQGACKRIGLTGTHGFRHAYAQARYAAMTGFACPVQGGPKRDEMTAAQLQADDWARDRVSSELGHGRQRVTNCILERVDREMAKSTKVSITLPPASYALLQQAAQENGINGAAAASLILQAALARRISGLVPKRPGKGGAGGGQSAGPAATDDSPSLGFPEGRTA